MSFRYLTESELLILNQALCRQHHQLFALTKPDVLSEALQRPQVCIDGYEPFPEIWEKAAVVMDSLLKEQPFLRANLLTGALAADLMLRLNGIAIQSQKEDIELIKSVALQQVTVLQIAEWLRHRAGSQV